jgi:uncharacterized protein involved in exopolysaccharide biosynthesis
MLMQTNDDRFPERSLRDVYYIIFRQKSKVVIFFLVVFITVAVGTFLTPSIYKSEAKLLVRIGRESVTLDPTATTGQVVSVGQIRENEIKSELDILRSQDLVEKVVDIIGPAALLNKEEEKAVKAEPPTGLVSKVTDKVGEYLGTAVDAVKVPLKAVFHQVSDRDKAILSVTKNLEIEAPKNSNSIAIAYEARDQKLAKEVIDRLIDAYLEKHINVHRTAGSYKFFNEQTDQFQNSLAQSEEDLRTLKDETGIASLEEQRRVLVERIGDLQLQIESTEAALAASSAKVWALQKTLTNLPEKQVVRETAGVGDMMRSKLYELQLKEQDLLSRYTENSIRVKEIRRQIAEAKALMDKEEKTRTEVSKGLNESYKQAELALIAERATSTSLQAKSKKLRALLTSAKSELRTVNDSEVRLAQVEREMNIQEANYKKYNEKLEQARIDHALEMEKISNISVVQPATYPVKPVKPRKMLNLVLGLFLGIFGALGLAFFTEYMDHTFKKPEDLVERLQLPMLTSIPRMLQNGRKGLMINADGKAFYDAIKEHLLVSNTTPEAPRIIALTSCHSGEGVSTVAYQLAVALAKRGNGRVLYVDSSRASDTAKLSSLMTEIRIDERGSVQTAQPVYARNADIIDNLLRFSEMKRLSHLMNLWRKAYSYVVMDAPAVLEEISTLRLASMADAVILVVGAEGVRWEVAQRAKALLGQANANVIGTVLNKRRFYVPEWVYKTL